MQTVASNLALNHFHKPQSMVSYVHIRDRATPFFLERINNKQQKLVVKQTMRQTDAEQPRL